MSVHLGAEVGKKTVLKFFYTGMTLLKHTELHTVGLKPGSHQGNCKLHPQFTRCQLFLWSISEAQKLDSIERNKSSTSKHIYMDFIHLDLSQHLWYGPSTMFLLLNWRHIYLMDKELAGWLHPKNYSSWLNVQEGTSNKWCPPRVWLV